jgi:hypothetical protein
MGLGVKMLHRAKGRMIAQPEQDLVEQGQVRSFQDFIDIERARRETGIFGGCGFTYLRKAGNGMQSWPELYKAYSTQ